MKNMERHQTFKQKHQISTDKRTNGRNMYAPIISNFAATSASPRRARSHSTMRHRQLRPIIYYFSTFEYGKVWNVYNLTIRVQRIRDIKSCIIASTWHSIKFKLLFEAAISSMMVNELAEDYVITEVSLE